MGNSLLLALVSNKGLCIVSPALRIVLFLSVGCFPTARQLGFSGNQKKHATTGGLCLVLWDSAKSYLSVPDLDTIALLQSIETPQSATPLQEGT